MLFRSNGQSDDDVAYLRGLRRRLYEQVTTPIQFPEPSLTLSLEQRSTRSRRFKHLHQTCVMHRENFAAGNRVKLLYLLDGFLAMIGAENPHGLYALSRSVCELNAFLHEVQVRLQEITLQVTEKSWQPLGEQFFGVVIRARFATTQPDHRAILITKGVSAARLKPFNIMHCIQRLASEPEHENVVERYEVLCDFVHHNLGSSTLANSGSGVADAARSASGGEMRHPSGETTITQYQYPVAGKVSRAVAALAPDFIRDTQACVQWLNLTPGGPFPMDMVVKVTGNPLGFQQLRPPMR